ncbi:Nuclear pore complex protein Nup98-Nup96 [Lambiella insularis]|nr:Nuclear pore complex protein Nup98-Nup96 [Lambiella insularis]
MSSFGFNSGFGASNNSNQQQSTGFGGFGANAGTGFGQQQPQQQNTGFGATNNNTGGGLFGSGGTGFGASTSTPFGGAKPAFGSTSTGGGGLFGSGNTTTGGSGGFGGFGANTSNTTNNASPFGSGNTTGGGLFGNASKPAFGTGSTGGGLFGNANSGTSFGQGNTQTPSLFGAPPSTALQSTNANVECVGTGSTPFQPFTEKDAPGSGATTNHYQSISCMQPYLKFSFEELRLADYNQGRRYGNSNGQAGAFGTSTGFGTFGQSQAQSNTGSLFSNNTSGFGPKPNTTPSAFGTGTTGGGLFGQAAGSGGGLFGNTATTSSQQTGGLFGAAVTSTAGNAFGNQPNPGGFGNNTGGLFGNNNQQQSAKPAFAFNTSTSGGGFGATGGFGSSTPATNNGGLFGNTSTQTQPPFGAQPSAPAPNPFGQSSQSTFSGFGNNNAQKPGGLFGSTPSASTGSSLFGPNAQSTTTNAFGTNNNQANSNSLFAPKPNQTGTTSLFGQPASSNSTGGLFGNGFGNNSNQAQQQQNAGGLFGNNNQQQQQPQQQNLGLSGSTALGGTGNIFGNTNSSSSLFNNLGANNAQNPGASLFQNIPNNNINGNSIFGGSQQNALQAPGAMTASIFDRNPYGSSSIFTGLPPPPQVSVGPIATPISAGQYKPKKYAPLPQYKINPTMSSRLVTPQKRGYGFSYSTYGTPSSASSTPIGLGNSLLGNSIGRSLGKSFSTSNLRRTYDNDAESILSPGAFSASSTRHSGAGSLKRLTIDRSLRTDLFGSQAVAALPSLDKGDSSRQPSILKKKVSFDATTLGGDGSQAQLIGPADSSANDSAKPSAQEQGQGRSSSRLNSKSNGAKPLAAPVQPEMEQVKGNELAIVHEDGSPEPSSTTTHEHTKGVQIDPEPGRYYMKPSREKLRKMPRDKLKKVSGFEIGREHCGHVVFDEAVDLTTVDLENIFDNIAVITLRSLTIYPQSDKKPPVGMGLNVPSTITLENSWPRQRDRKTPSYEKSGPKFNKHVDRLQKVIGTEFVNYNKDTGEWVFRVPHFTTYALDYDDDDTREVEDFQTSGLSELQSTPTPKPRSTPRPRQSAQESSMLSEETSQLSSGPEDTFDFRKKRLFPGAFDARPAFDNHREIEEVQQHEQSFLGESSAPSPSDNGVEEPSDLEMDHEQSQDKSLVIQDDDTDMVGAFPQVAEYDDGEVRDENMFPKSILKASRMDYGTPGKSLFHMGDDWAEQLQRTISPRKQDRQALRQSQALLFDESVHEREETPITRAPPRDAKGFATSIDLMNSLFGKEQARKSGRSVKQTGSGKGFEWPYPKRDEHRDQPEMSAADQAFHESFKPTWGPGSRLLYALPSESGELQQRPSKSQGLLRDISTTIVSEGRDIRFSGFAIPSDITPENFSKQRAGSSIMIEHGIPYAKARALPFLTTAPVYTASKHEHLVWKLASILFDDDDTDIGSDLPGPLRPNYEHRIRKDRLSDFWSQICQDKALAAVSAAPTAEERAIAYLSMHKVAEACDALMEGKDFRLATLIAQIGGDITMHEDMTTQIDAWRALKNLSEMTDPVRTLYALLAGHTCICQGTKGAMEDQAKTFVISERFQLDWKRSFGLRLWYAIQEEEPLEVAVKRYARDLETEETQTPIPWFMEEEVSLPWSDQHAEDREDILWGVLKLYADMKAGTSTTRLVDVIMPQNVSGNPVDARFSFEIYHALSTRLPDHVDLQRADQLAWDFATHIESAGEWHWAAFALLHLSDAAQRQKALQTLLAHHAIDINKSDTEQFTFLTESLKIPEAWIWTAKALYARSVQQDHVKEVDYLLRAEAWNEAHKTLCRVVAPQATIEQDHATLLMLLDNFAGKDQVSEWYLGGQVYEDYTRLKRGLSGHEKNLALYRMVNALPMLVQNKPGDLGFAERVAIEEMSKLVGLAVLSDDEKTFPSSVVLNLPVAGDTHLKQALSLSLNYYKALMTDG